MEPPHHLTFGPFRLDVTHGRLWRGEQVMALRPRSLAMLHYLVEHPGRLVTKAELRRQVWVGTHVTDSVLRVSVREIRAALGDSATTPHYLETVGRQGYRFLVGGERSAPPASDDRAHWWDARGKSMLEQWFQRAAQRHPPARLREWGGWGSGRRRWSISFWPVWRLGGGARIARGQCVEHYGEGEPYLPCARGPGAVSAGGRWGAGDCAALRRYAPMWLVQLPGLVSETELERLQRQVHGATPARMLRELAEALDGADRRHAAGAGTRRLALERQLHGGVLAYLAQHLEPARLLVLGTYRPVDAMLRAHPLRRTVQELCGRGQALGAAPRVPARRGCRGLCSWAAVEGRSRPPWRRSSIERTDGNALFMVNMR